MQITSAESFAMLADDGARGRTIRLRAQQAAGLMPHPALIQKGACRGGPDAV